MKIKWGSVLAALKDILPLTIYKVVTQHYMPRYDEKYNATIFMFFPWLSERVVT
jgi:hypothetical protein